MPFDPAAAGWKPRHGQGPFTQLVGPIWGRRGGAEGSVHGLLVEERHLNSRGVVHGGMLMALADHVLGWLVFEAVGGAPCVTVSMNSQFMGAVKPGDWLEMRGSVVRQTRSLVFVAGPMTVDGKTVFTAEGIWKILGAG